MGRGGYQRGGHQHAGHQQHGHADNRSNAAPSSSPTSVSQKQLAPPDQYKAPQGTYTDQSVIDSVGISPKWSHCLRCGKPKGTSHPAFGDCQDKCGFCHTLKHKDEPCNFLRKLMEESYAKVLERDARIRCLNQELSTLEDAVTRREATKYQNLLDNAVKDAVKNAVTKARNEWQNEVDAILKANTAKAYKKAQDDLLLAAAQVRKSSAMVAADEAALAQVNEEIAAELRAQERRDLLREQLADEEEEDETEEEEEEDMDLDSTEVKGEKSDPPGDEGGNCDVSLE
jgi:hypothetical protein